MQDVAHCRPSTVSRRLSIIAGYYRTCVIDAVPPASLAEYVRRPRVPGESPTLGLNRLQFEAMLSVSFQRRPGPGWSAIERARQTGRQRANQRITFIDGLNYIIDRRII